MAQEIGPNQRKWIDELRSGKWEQGRHYLSCNGKKCCLGVGCEIFDIPGTPALSNEDVTVYEGSHQLAPKSLQEKLSLRNKFGGLSGATAKRGDHESECTELVGMNDCGMTFEQIADFCEAHPEAVFTESR